MTSSLGEYRADSIAGACDGSLRLWKSDSGGAGYASHRVDFSSRVCVVAWNRNNKVVASACEDGSIQLCYSTGEAMARLPREGGSGALGRPTDLSWSQGSKRLAVSTADGRVHVHDMTLRVRREVGWGTVCCRHDVGRNGIQPPTPPWCIMAGRMPWAWHDGMEQCCAPRVTCVPWRHGARC